MYTENAALKSALAFAARGYPVLPLYGYHDNRCACGDIACHSPAKHPHPRLAPHGVKDATCDAAAIKSWWKQHEWLNVGVATEALLVADIDPRNGGDEAWLKLIKKNFDVHTWRVRTGGGGEPIIFANPQGLGNGKLARGVDVKGAGGYIVGVGSLHVSGKRYAWAPQCRPDEAELLDPPRWIVDALKEQKPSGARPVEHYRELVRNGAPEGERNQQIATLTGHLIAKGVDPIVTHTLLQAWNLHRCFPPLAEDEVEHTVASITARELRRLGVIR
jgi:hypothetical protein